LLATGAEVTAIERDRDMASVLRKELTHESLRVVEANAVQVDFAEAALGPGDAGPGVVVAVTVPESL
jgi:16S rRNA (adenine1518-N6/adenine1519-N6)-dimethyltransferase